jgi:hypothetical protein
MLPVKTLSILFFRIALYVKQVVDSQLSATDPAENEIDTEHIVEQELQDTPSWARLARKDKDNTFVGPEEEYEER